jgi:excisionase family DNA binding protein
MWVMRLAFFNARGARMTKAVYDQTLPNPKLQPTLSVEQAGDLLGVSRGAAYQAIREDQIPHFKIGKRIIVPTSQVLAMLGVAGDDHANQS